MARSYNKVILMGNLTRDVEMRFTPNNTAVGNFGLAMNRQWQDPQGQTREEVTFVDCEVWGKTAETFSKYLTKGKPVFIEGRLKLDSWKDKTDGSNRSKLKVVVEEFRFVGAPAGAGQPGAGGGPEGPEDMGGDSGPSQGQSSGAARPSYNAAPPAPRGRPAAPAAQPMNEEDIPF